MKPNKKLNWKKIIIKTSLVAVGLYMFGGISFSAGLAEGLRQGARRFFYYYIIKHA
jgi:hypothetical protein